MKTLEHRPGGPGLDSPPGQQPAAGLGGSRTDRWIMWSARALLAIGVSYAVMMAVGFAAMGNAGRVTSEDPSPRGGMHDGAEAG
jgi:hypothetical protein